jgi:2,3-dihydroxy-2,3-dihydrophenylpropionate dehydrogenase
VGWLDGKTVLAVGGGSGIGRAAVAAFVEEGAQVGVMDLVPDKLASLEKELGDAVATFAGDATSYEANVRAVEGTVDALGGIDVLAHFVGVHDSFTSLIDLPVEKVEPAYEELFAINVKSAILSVKAALEQLIASEGSIIITVSGAGFHPGGGGVLYTASKFAVRGLVTQLAFELAPKVRVNGVAPGGTVTGIRGLHSLDAHDVTLQTIFPDMEAARQAIVGQTPLDWEPVPEVHTGAYVYLASKEHCSNVTGMVIPTDGGIAVRGVLKLAGLKN